MKPNSFDTTAADGGPDVINTSMTLKDLKDEVGDIATNHHKRLYTTRLHTEETRFCVWDGQSEDGRKHAQAAGEEVLPFPGATDSRVRTSDLLVNEDVVLLSLATNRARVNVKGVGADDKERAAKVGHAFQWMLRTQLGLSWSRELIKLIQYMSAYSPAVSLMCVDWRNRIELRYESVSVEELMRFYQDEALRSVTDDPALAGEVSADEFLALAEQTAGDFVAMLMDDESDDEELIGLLMRMFPGIREGRAKKVVRGLRKVGTAEFPMPYLAYSGPEVKARQLNVDFFVPVSTNDFQRARCYFVLEDLTKTEILSRKATMGWSDEFVKGMLGREHGGEGDGTEGKRVFAEYNREGDVLRDIDASNFKGVYQVVYAYYQAVNADGVTGRYVLPFHPDVEVAATKPSLVDYAHGLYPAHAFQREVLTDRLLDSRGIAEISGVNQGLLKMFVDTAGDNGQMCGVPPVKSRNRKNEARLLLAPLQEVKLKRDGDVSYMDPPKYPPQIEQMITELRRQMDEYFGRMNPDVDPGLVQMHREFKVWWFMQNLKEVYTMLLQIMQQFMPAEMINLITDSQGEPMFASPEEIQGQFDLEVTFDPRDFDPEFLKTEAEIISSILMSMDRSQTIVADELVKDYMWRLRPDVAERMLRTVDKANESELEDELKNYQLILSGVEPPRVTDGSLNYELRRQMYDQMQQQNPEIYNNLPMDRIALLNAHTEYLEAQAQQYGENVTVGREGAKRAELAG